MDAVWLVCTYMPPTTVHMAIGGLIACALLHEHFDTRAIVIVLAATAILDIDAFFGVFMTGAHRTVLHNIWLPLGVLALLTWDVKARSNSFVLDRWGKYGWRVGWVTVVAVLFGHILLDAFYNGANLFWPLHDQFYNLSGHLLISNHQGIEQTFIELGEDSTTARGSSADVHYWTAVEPPASEPAENPERIAYVAETGEQILLTVIGFGVVLYRIAEYRLSGDN